MRTKGACLLKVPLSRLMLCTARVGANKGRAIKAGTGGKCRTIWSRSQEVAVAESGAAKVMSRGQG